MKLGLLRGLALPPARGASRMDGVRYRKVAPREEPSAGAATAPRKRKKPCLRSGPDSG